MNISVVIPTHNMANTLARAVDSAIAAGASEVVVVNDSSTDDTFKVMRRYVAGYRVRFISTPLPAGVRAGVCFARNAGIHEARSNWIVPLDADDVLLPDGLNALAAAAATNTLVYGGWLESAPRHYPEADTALMNEVAVSAPPPQRLSHKNVTHATFLFQKADWRRVGGYDPQFEAGCEDWALMCALVSAGVQPVRVNAPIYRKYVNCEGRGAACAPKAALLHTLLEQTYPAVFHAI
ncbi:MAG: glycosyltransferase family 2 protein [Desulfurellales bacterium]|nr:MAG: glycosyltransferase family 2 protein [Desulfurellales bacterium]